LYANARLGKRGALAPGIPAKQRGRGTPANTKRKEIGMSVILTKAVIRQGQVIVAKPIDLPDGHPLGGVGDLSIE